MEYWVLASFTEFHWVFTEFYCADPMNWIGSFESVYSWLILYADVSVSSKNILSTYVWEVSISYHTQPWDNWFGWHGDLKGWNLGCEEGHLLVDYGVLWPLNVCTGSVWRWDEGHQDTATEGLVLMCVCARQHAIHRHTRTHTQTRTYTHKHTHTQSHTHTHMHTHTYTHTHTHTHVHTHTHTHKQTWKTASR